MRQSSIPSIPTQVVTATINSAPINTENIFNGSFHAIVNGSLTGIVKVQASNDSSLVPTNPINWSDIPSASIAVTNTGTYLIPKIDICYEFIRVVFVYTSGSGSPTIQVNTKLLGA
jgi:hypothetical protein